MESLRVALSFDESDRGVSPIIGILLMVALTVTLASVAGTGMIGMLNPATDDVYVSFRISTSNTGDTIALTHTGGTPLKSSRTEVIVATENTRQTFEPTEESYVLDPGKTAIIDLEMVGGNNRIDWNTSETGWEYNQSGSFDGISDDENLTLIVIDSGSNTILFNGSIVSGDGSTATQTTTPQTATPTPTPTATPTPTPTPSPTATPVPNQQPTAEFTFTRKGASHNVDLDASGSSDPDGSISTYEWDVGDDGSIEYTGETVTNANVPVGETVNLTVTDNDGATDNRTKTIP